MRVPEAVPIAYPRLDVVDRFVDIPLDEEALPRVMGGTGDESDEDWVNGVPGTRVLQTMDTRLIDDDGTSRLKSKYKRWGATETRGGVEIIHSDHFAPTAGALEDMEGTGHDEGEWFDDAEAFEQVKKLDPACLLPPEQTGVREVVACAVAIAAELEEKSRAPRRTALKLAQEGVVTGAHKIHDGAELVVDSLVSLPWADAARTVYDGTVDTAVKIGRAGKSIARAVAATPLAKRAARTADEIVTGAGIGAMGVARDLLEVIKTKLEGTVADLDNRMVNMENRLNPPNLRGQFVSVGEEDDDEVILVTRKNPREEDMRPRRQSPDVLGGHDDFDEALDE